MFLLQDKEISTPLQNRGKMVFCGKGLHFDLINLSHIHYFHFCMACVWLTAVWFKSRIFQEQDIPSNRFSVLPRVTTQVCALGRCQTPVTPRFVSSIRALNTVLWLFWALLLLTPSRSLRLTSETQQQKHGKVHTHCCAPALCFCFFFSLSPYTSYMPHAHTETCPRGQSPQLHTPRTTHCRVSNLATCSLRHGKERKNGSAACVFIVCRSTTTLNERIFNLHIDTWAHSTIKQDSQIIKTEWISVC